MEEQCVTSGELTGSPGGAGVSGPISASEVASDALSAVGRLNSTYKARRKPRDRATGDGSGSGKAAGEDGREEKGNQMSKDEGGRNSSFSENRHLSRKLCLTRCSALPTNSTIQCWMCVKPEKILD